jgi:hypothetical protein
MNVQTNLRMDKPTFLAWVQEREGRYELDDGHVVMMTGGTRGHGRILRRPRRTGASVRKHPTWSAAPAYP